MRASPQSRPVRLVSRAPDLPQLIVPKRYADDRGWFSETFHEQRLRGAGIACHFVQDNRSRSKRAGTLRGLHFQLPPAAQAKLVCVLRGRILDVALDIRSGSPTYGRNVSAELSADDGRQLYVPIGFAHGFCTLEDDVEVMYKVSDYYARRSTAVSGGMTRISAFPGRSLRATSSFPRRTVACLRSRISSARLPMTAIRWRRWRRRKRDRSEELP
jgi:dTDP-4-dehydrorhamnose 3,5-epimerase